MLLWFLTSLWIDSCWFFTMETSQWCVFFSLSIFGPSKCFSIHSIQNGWLLDEIVIVKCRLVIKSVVHGHLPLIFLICHFLRIVNASTNMLYVKYVLCKQIIILAKVKHKSKTFLGDGKLCNCFCFSARLNNSVCPFSLIFLLSNNFCCCFFLCGENHLQQRTVWMLWTSGKLAHTYSTSNRLYGCWLTCSQYDSKSRKAQTPWGTGILVETSSWRAEKSM